MVITTGVPRIPASTYRSGKNTHDIAATVPNIPYSCWMWMISASREAIRKAHLTNFRGSFDPIGRGTFSTRDSDISPVRSST